MPGPHTPRAPENPDATMIDSLKDKNLRNHIWHADGGFRPDAPAFTALFAQQLPELRRRHDVQQHGVGL